MSTQETIHSTDEIKKDAQAVIASVFSGKPLDPEVARRVRERTAKITEELRRQHGAMTIAEDLVRGIREEA